MNKRLTILQTLPALHSGGVERGTLEIARALVAAGHRSIVVSNGGRLVEQLVREGSEHIMLPVHRKSLASLFQVSPFRLLLQALKPDIVHARSRVPAWIAWLALRRMDVKTRPRFVTTVHGLYSINPYSAIMAKGERVIVVSETVRDYVLQNYKRCPPESIQLIYRGVSPEEFQYGFKPAETWLERWQKDFPQLKSKTVLALPGRIARVKGHESFIKLIAALRHDWPQLHGLIIGGAEKAKEAYEAELRAFVKAEGLDEHITFTGHRNDMNQALSQCDLVLALRITPEAFGRTTLEPLRLGKPVIGWDVGGVGEILRRMYPFGAVPAGDEAALIVRVREWLAAPQSMPERDDFQLSDMCADTLKVYAEVANAKPTQ